MRRRRPPLRTHPATAAADAVWRTLHEQCYVDERRPERDSSLNLWALILADIEESAPTPTPDAIRRGHEAAEALAYAASRGPHNHLPAAAEKLLEDARAAMHPLPKETP